MEQVSIFTENTRGAMQGLTGALSAAGINIMGMVTNDSAEYGIVRMVVSDTENAVKVLQDAGYICKATPVIGVEINDRVGALDALLCALRESYVNVDYLYISYDRDSSRPIMILHTEDISEVENCLEGKGFQIV